MKRVKRSTHRNHTPTRKSRKTSDVPPQVRSIIQVDGQNLDQVSIALQELGVNIISKYLSKTTGICLLRVSGRKLVLESLEESRPHWLISHSVDNLPIPQNSRSTILKED